MPAYVDVQAELIAFIYSLVTFVIYPVEEIVVLIQLGLLEAG
ncbi:hypothetical protein [Shewanella psychropiezotolerans]|nr:hypothetical protein [Shewanella psychropiezotolerans]